MSRDSQGQPSFAEAVAAQTRASSKAELAKAQLQAVRRSDERIDRTVDWVRRHLPDLDEPLAVGAALTLTFWQHQGGPRVTPDAVRERVNRRVG